MVIVRWDSQYRAVCVTWVMQIFGLNVEWILLAGLAIDLAVTHVPVRMKGHGLTDRSAFFILGPGDIKRRREDRNYFLIDKNSYLADQQKIQVPLFIYLEKGFSCTSAKIKELELSSYWHPWQPLKQKALSLNLPNFYTPLAMIDVRRAKSVFDSILKLSEVSGWKKFKP